MAKKSSDTSKSDGSALTHNPFAKLASDAELASKVASSQPPAAVVRRRPIQVPPTPRLSMRHESKGRAGKAVTRISGVPRELLDTVASRLRRALGCGANVEGEDVVLMGSLKERAAEWFDRVGDVRKLAQESPAAVVSQAQQVPPRPAPPSVSMAASATRRSDVRRGLRVAVVLKADQVSGKLTEGVVRDLLTNSAEHPRGIKVRLESGEVGRVKIIYE